MPPATGRGNVRVNAQGLVDLRRAMRRISPTLDREISRVIRQSVNLVRDEARAKAPVGTAEWDHHPGQLKRSIRSSVRRKYASIYSDLDYAPVQEFGGTISPRGNEIHIHGRDFLYSTAIRNEPRIENALANVVDTAARQAGFH